MNKIIWTCTGKPDNLRKYKFIQFILVYILFQLDGALAQPWYLRWLVQQ